MARFARQPHLHRHVCRWKPTRAHGGGEGKGYRGCTPRNTWVQTASTVKWIVRTFKNILSQKGNNYINLTGELFAIKKGKGGASIGSAGGGGSVSYASYGTLFPVELLTFNN